MPAATSCTQSRRKCRRLSSACATRLNRGFASPNRSRTNCGKNGANGNSRLLSFSDCVEKLSFAQGDRHVHFLAVANYRERNAVTWLRTIEQQIQIHLTGHRLATHGDENVPAAAQFLQARQHGLVASANSCFRGGTARVTQLAPNS